MTENAQSLGIFGKTKSLYCRFSGGANALQSLAALALRLVIARMFLKSGIIKVKDFETAVDLFEYEYFEGIPHVLAIIAAFMATVGETVLPLMLIIGFMTRFASAGLLVMTIVILLFVYPLWTTAGLNFWWNDHAWWTVILFAILAYGPGKISLDALLCKKP